MNCEIAIQRNDSGIQRLYAMYADYVNETIAESETDSGRILNENSSI